MLSVIIPTLNEEARLPRTLASLVPATVHGLVKEVIIVDGGSSDGTCDIAEVAGTRLIRTERGRGRQLAAGAAAACAEWLLFLHADTYLEAGWEEEVRSLLRREGDPPPDIAAAFRFALDDITPRARRLEAMVAWRCRLLALPYGDQGLILPRRFYDALGGFEPLDLMEDVDLIRRIGRARLVMLRSAAVTSAERYRAGGYFLRPLRNLSILTLYFFRVPTRVLARLYG